MCAYRAVCLLTTSSTANLTIHSRRTGGCIRHATAGLIGQHCGCPETADFLGTRGVPCTKRLVQAGFYTVLISSCPPKTFLWTCGQRNAQSCYDNKQKRTGNYVASSLCKCIFCLLKSFVMPACKQVSSPPLTPPCAPGWSVEPCEVAHICLICTGRLVYCGFNWAYEENSMWLDIVTKVYHAISYLKMVKKIKNQFGGGGWWTEIME